MACGCFCCRKPRHKRLIDGLFPADPQDSVPVTAEQDKLLFFARSSPEHLDRVGEYLALRLRRSLTRDRRGHVVVALKITEKLIAECSPQRLQLIVDSYLDMLHTMLESTHTDMQIMATNSFVVFAEREEDSTPYHRQYDFFIHRFASMSLVPDSGDSTPLDTRRAGLQGLQGVIKKVGKQEGLQLNIWDWDHMNKIVPAFLFILQEQTTQREREIEVAGVSELVLLAEDGLKDLVTFAGLAHVDSVIQPVLKHFDLNDLWTKQKEFAAGVFKTLIQTMQQQDRYKGIQALVDHLDAKSQESCDLKQGILDTLSQCVAVAAGGSIGPSVLDVFRTLVRHLRISIESSAEQSQDRDSAFQLSITKTMGEFAGALPDYHKPDIMNLINSYMPLDTPRNSSVKHPLQERSSRESMSRQSHNWMLSTSLVRCLRAVADTYHPSILETTFPEALFSSLVQLLRIKEHNVQLDVSILWHQLIDHQNNKTKIPFNTTWDSLESCGLTLGKVSDRFLNKIRGSLYTHLLENARVLSTRQENLKAFYQLLYLLVLEFAHPGIMDMTHFLSKLQDMALTDTSLSSRHCIAIHSIIAGLLYLLAKMTSNQVLREHVFEVIAKRQQISPSLLPDSLFSTEGSDGPEMDLANLDPELLFLLQQEGILDEQRRDPGGAYREFSREFSTSSHSEVGHHFSVSLDCGPESPLSVEQITFNSFKEKLAMMSSPEGSEPAGISGQSIPTIAMTTFDELVGRSSMQETGLTGLADILNTTGPSESHARSTSAYDIELPTLH